MQYYEMTYSANLNFPQLIMQNLIGSTIYNQFASAGRFKGAEFVLSLTGDGAQTPFADWTQAGSPHLTFTSGLFNEPAPPARVFDGSTYTARAYSTQAQLKPTASFTGTEGTVTMRLSVKVPYQTLVARLLDNDTANDSVTIQKALVTGRIQSDSEGLLGSGGENWRTAAPIIFEMTASPAHAQLRVVSAKPLLSVYYHPNLGTGDRYRDINSGNGYTAAMSPAVLALDKTGIAPPAEVSLASMFAWRFTGWNTRADGSGKMYQPGDTLRFADFDGEPVLYAQWQIGAETAQLLPADLLVKKAADTVFTTEHDKAFPVSSGDIVDLRGTIDAKAIYDQLQSLSGSAGERAANIQIKSLRSVFTLRLTIPKGLSLPADYKDRLALQVKNQFFRLGDAQDIALTNGVLIVPMVLNEDYTDRFFPELQDDLGALVENGRLPLTLDIAGAKVDGTAAGSLTLTGTVTGVMDADVLYNGAAMKIGFDYASTQETPALLGDAVPQSDPAAVSLTVNALAAAGAGPATEDRAQTGLWGTLLLLSAGLALPAAAKSRKLGLR